MHQPFRLRAKLRTPVAYGVTSVMLDSLVARALYLHHGDYVVADAEMRKLFAQTDGIVHASSMAFIVSAESTVSARPIPWVGAIRHGDGRLSDAHVRPYGSRTPYPRLMTEGGPYKNRLRIDQGYYSDEVLWHGVGDARQISALLSFYVINIGRGGWPGSAGDIESFTAEPVEIDESLIDATGQPARPLPVELFQKLSGGVRVKHPDFARVHQPYWRKEGRVDAVNPPRVRKIAL